MGPTLATVRNYYDERVDGKIRDFTHANPRIEKAFMAVTNWLPPTANKILEIGCGIGAASWRLACLKPQSSVLGVDISSRSIEVAQTCFRRPNLAYRELLLERGSLADRYDYVIMMDVYEHISTAERSELHATLAELLTDEGRLFLSFPTPDHQRFLKRYLPDHIQPVDEDITPETLSRLASDVGAQLLFYRAISIWRTEDYAHAVIGRTKSMEPINTATPTLLGTILKTLSDLIHKQRPGIALSLSNRTRASMMCPWYISAAAREQAIGATRITE